MLELPGAFWSTHPELQARLGRVVTEALRTKGPGDRDPDVLRRLRAWSRELGSATLPEDAPGAASHEPAR